MNHWHAYDRWEHAMTMSSETRDAVREGAKRSAAVVLPFVFETLGTPDALIDVGAGEGWWPLAAHNLGVEYVHGADLECGFVPDPDHAGEPMIPIDAWNAETGEDIPMPPPMFDRWDLALCLETAEHLTQAAGDHLVSELCRVATEIVWSAAIPGQGGDGHINEQWPSYWNERFNRHGYALGDPGWRMNAWDDPDVEPWYAQNLLHAFPLAGHGYVRSEAPAALVHPVTWSFHRGVPAPGAV